MFPHSLAIGPNAVLDRVVDGLPLVDGRGQLSQSLEVRAVKEVNRAVSCLHPTSLFFIQEKPNL